jgi:hypothetical protein
MLVLALFVVGLVAGAIYVATRVYIGLRRGEIWLKYNRYDREGTPVRFWTTMLIACIAFVGIIGMAVRLSLLAS